MLNKQSIAKAKAAKPRPKKKAAAKKPKKARSPGMTDKTVQRHTDWWREGGGRRLRQLRHLIDCKSPDSTIREAFSIAGRDGLAIGYALVGHTPTSGRK